MPFHSPSSCPESASQAATDSAETAADGSGPARDTGPHTGQGASDSPISARDGDSDGGSEPPPRRGGAGHRRAWPAATVALRARLQPGSADGDDTRAALDDGFTHAAERSHAGDDAASPPPATAPHSPGSRDGLDGLDREGLLARVRGLERAVSSRDVIGQAKGVIRGVAGLGDAAAFDVLRWVSQYTNVKLHTVAELLLDRIDTDLPVPNEPRRAAFAALLTTLTTDLRDGPDPAGYTGHADHDCTDGARHPQQRPQQQPQRPGT